MHRFALTLCCALVLAACAGDKPQSPRQVRAVAGFTGPEATKILVEVYEIPPGTAIERILLLGPGGERLAAPELRRSSSETGPGLLARPSIGVAVTGGSSSGVTPSLSLGYGVTRASGPDRKTRQVSATIALPDPAAYRAEAGSWRVEVHYLDVTGDARVLTLPAPRFR